MEIKEINSKTSRNKLALLILNSIVLAIGNCCGPLIMRLYFLHGGKRIWLSRWLETVGWPVILIPLAFSYFHRRKTAAKTAGTTTTTTITTNNLDTGTGKTKLILMKPTLFAAAAVIGVITGLDDYFYAYGVARLPVSTSSLIIASQLAFTAVFSFILVRQKFTSYSINAIVLVTAGGAVLALHTRGDKPAEESKKAYVVGFVMTVAAALLYGFILPVVELAYNRAKQEINYTLVMEFQLVMSFFATAFCTVGMLVNHDFKAIPREAREFGLGETKYYVIMAGSAVMAGIFHGSDRCRILCFVFVLRNRNSGFITGDGDLPSLLSGKILRRERVCPCSSPFGALPPTFTAKSSTVRRPRSGSGRFRCRDSRSQQVQNRFRYPDFLFLFFIFFC